jgi:hypothetical protein
MYSLEYKIWEMYSLEYKNRVFLYSKEYIAPTTPFCNLRNTLAADPCFSNPSYAKRLWAKSGGSSS